MNALESPFAKLEDRMSRAAGLMPERPAPAPVPETGAWLQDRPTHS